MRKILLVSHSYTPAITPRAFRWSAIAEYWARQGDRVDVVSAWNPGLLQKEFINGVCVHRVGGAITEALRNKLQKPGTSPNIVLDKPTAFDGLRTNQYLTSLVKWVHDQTWKKIYWPDYACLWYFPALKKAQQLLKLYNYTALITVSHPFTGHLVGLQLKKDYPKIPWLIDIGDPFCFLEDRHPNNYKLYKSINYKSEREIFRYGNRVAVTTPATLEKYANLFPENVAKIRVIPPLISIPKNYQMLDSIFPADRKIRLIFVGTLYKNLRSPEFLLRLFKYLLRTHLSDRLEIHFFGNIYDCQECFKPYKDLFNNKIFIHGIVGHSIVIQALKEADILVNIGNNNPYQLPSKIVEYASTIKPILNLIKIENDSSLAFLETYPISLCLLENSVTSASQNLEQFAKLVDFIENPPSISASLLQNWLAAFQLEAIVIKYEELFKSIIPS